MALSPTDLCFLELSEVSQLIRSQAVSAEEVTAAVLRRIDELNPSLNCYITVLHQAAMESAANLQRELRRGGWRGLLHGVPVSVKDNILTAGIRTTAGSPLLKEWTPDRNAEVVQRLGSAGAVLIGKTNLMQYAYAAAHPLFGEPRNPHRLEMTCGGSSSGSAAATAAGMGFGSVGTDTGGSIRIPAAFCGVVGLKPTYGVVSRRGVIPISNNLDHVGPIARTVRDCAIMFGSICGLDEDHFERKYLNELERGVLGFRLGVVRLQGQSYVDAEVGTAFDRACHELVGLGATLREVEVPDLAQAQLIMYTLSGVEAAELHRDQFRQQREQYNPALRTRLEIAEFVPAIEYVHAQRVRQRFRIEVDMLFREVDALLLPAVGIAAYESGTNRLRFGGGKEEDVANVGSRFTALFNLTGHPALVLPCGANEANLPIGLQVVCAPHHEAVLFRVARAYEQLNRWYKRRPAGVETASPGL